MAFYRYVFPLVVGVLSLTLATSCKRKTPPPKRRVAVKKKRIVKRKRYQPKIPPLPKGVVLKKNEVWVNGGRFILGGKIEGNEFTQYNARHLVVLTRMYAIWRHEVTQKEFQDLMGYNPSFFSQCGPNCPVEQVNWHEAALFCNKLSEKHELSKCYLCRREGKKAQCKVRLEFSGSRYYRCSGYRLPTEAEWIHAAQVEEGRKLYVPALSQTEEKDRLKLLDKIAWFEKNSKVSYKSGFHCKVAKKAKKGVSSSGFCGTHPVEQKEPNLLGVYDMLGNVFEWVADDFHYFTQDPLKDPIFMGGSLGKVQLGCSWLSPDSFCQIGWRIHLSPSTRGNFLGFRPVRTLWLALPEKR